MSSGNCGWTYELYTFSFLLQAPRKTRRVDEVTGLFLDLWRALSRLYLF